MEGLFPVLKAEHDHIATLPQVLTQTCLYGYVLFVAANMIGDGAELLLLVPSMAALVGSIVLPILGAVPDGMMVLCSGLGPDAQEQVKVGVGALAGSTIMLLTLPWFLSVYSGRVSIRNGEPTYTQPKDAPKNWLKLDPPGDMSLRHTGVGIGDEIQKNAWIMLKTCTSYLIIQIPACMVDSMNGKNPKPDGLTDAEANKESHFETPFAWAGLVMTMVWFMWYLYKMYKEGQSGEGAVQDSIVHATVAGIQDGQLTLRGAMMQFRETTWDTLCSKGGLEEGLLKKGSEAEDEVRKMCRLLVPFYRIYDTDQDGKISPSEFAMILKDLHENVSPDVQKRIFDAADADGSGEISFEEFIACMMAFALDPNDSLMGHTEPNAVKRLPTESAYLADGEDGDAEEEDMPEDLCDLPPEEQQKRLKKRAFSNMFIGTVLVLLFSDPMTDMLGLIGDMTGVPKFYISFLFAPLASNASELVSAMKLAQKRTLKSMVQSLSTLEGAAIMNNTFCLGIFFVLIVWKNLVWQFTAETVSIVAIEVMMAVMALTKRVHTLMDGVIIVSFYPISLVIVYALENFLFLD
eukprot:TRINITY_DN45800_c0_g1_i1.p2 TRINITY_DN45800_c0_g1~~TRINITY_DN45800_c0_g1_i1.p2  ORF type:complete len:576 (-),score=156.36 TRINITY_DN45800_c0_g1_i1:53-1780(-)